MRCCWGWRPRRPASLHAGVGFGALPGGGLAKVVAEAAGGLLGLLALSLAVGLGVPIHIMASMGPVFLMAISTDTVHIFNEFYFRSSPRKRGSSLRPLDCFVGLTPSSQ